MTGVAASDAVERGVAPTVARAGAEVGGARGASVNGSVTLALTDESVATLVGKVCEIVLAEIGEQTDRSSLGEWLNVASAAAYLDVSVERIRKLVARRAIPYYQEGVGCRILFRRSELDDWMAQFRQPTTGGA